MVDASRLRQERRPMPFGAKPSKDEERRCENVSWKECIIKVSMRRPVQAPERAEHFVLQICMPILALYSSIREMGIYLQNAIQQDLVSVVLQQTSDHHLALEPESHELNF